MITTANRPAGPPPRPRNFPKDLQQAVDGAQKMAGSYEGRWEDPDYFNNIAAKLPAFEADFQKVLAQAPLPKSVEEFHQLLLKAVVGGIAVGVATEALTHAGKLPAPPEAPPSR